MQVYPILLNEEVGYYLCPTIVAAANCKGYDFEKCCYFSSAVSAIKCTEIGARESVHDFDTVKIFLKEKGYEL